MMLSTFVPKNVVDNRMENQKDRLTKAGSNLQDMLAELEPYIRRPVVEKPSTKGRWVRSDAKSDVLRQEAPEAQSS